MIYDGFPFFNELELLEIRLHELDGLVDRFVLAESTMTHSGKPKPLFFHENRIKFQKFLPKIAHIIVTDMPVTQDPWVRENHQRVCIMRGMPHAQDSDTLILSDLDEIPRASAVREAMPFPEIAMLDMAFYAGYLNAYGGQWAYAKVGPVSEYRKIGLQAARLKTDCSRVVKDAGWHFSYIGGVDRMAMKLESFAHQEREVQKHNRRDELKKKFETGIHWNGSVMDFRPIDSTFPRYILENLEKYKSMIRKAP